MRAHLAKLCVLFLFLSGAYAAAAQQAPSGKPQNTSAKDTCSIAGLVVKLGSNEPLKKAHVYLEKVDDPSLGYSAHTDAAGHFAIRKIDPGRYNLRVEHSGYVSQFYGETSSEAMASSWHSVRGARFKICSSAWCLRQSFQEELPMKTVTRFRRWKSRRCAITSEKENGPLRPRVWHGRMISVSFDCSGFPKAATLFARRLTRGGA